MEEIVVIPKYRNDPSLEELTELISRLRDAFPQADVRRQDPIEPKGHEATFWEVVQLVFGDVSNATTIATAVVVVKGYLKKRRERNKSDIRPKSIQLLGPARIVLSEVVLDGDDEPKELPVAEDKP